MPDHAHRECGACHRLRSVTDLTEVTVTNEHGDEQATMYVACKDSKHCVTIVRSRIANDTTREKM